MSRPATVYVLVWVMAYMALRDVAGIVLTMHEVPWLSHPAEFALTLARGGAALLAAVWTWQVRRRGLALTAAWLVGFGVLAPLAWWPIDPYAAIRGPWLIAVPAFLPLLWAWRRAPWT